MNNFTTQFLDDMTNEEKSIFLYSFIFKLSQTETAKRLKLRKEFVNYTCKNLEKYHDQIEIKEKIQHAWLAE